MGSAYLFSPCGSGCARWQCSIVWDKRLARRWSMRRGLAPVPPLGCQGTGCISLKSMWLGFGCLGGRGDSWGWPSWRYLLGLLSFPPMPFAIWPRWIQQGLLQIQMLQIQVQIDAHSQMAVAWPIHVLKSPTLACLSWTFLCLPSKSLGESNHSGCGNFGGKFMIIWTQWECTMPFSTSKVWSTAMMLL